MNHILITATVPSMIGQFNMDNIDILQSMGCQVHIACNFRDTSIWPTERIDMFIKKLEAKNIVCHQIDFPRNPRFLFKVIKSSRQLNNLLITNSFKLIHCHTPLAGCLSRIVAHRHKVKVIYTAHGFHFYDGAPLLNWLLYYPVEKFLSRWTDILITITKEDFSRAVNKFHAQRVEYISGVGIDVNQFVVNDIGRNQIRDGFGLHDDDILLLSVGGLDDNKNHKVVLNALKLLNNNKLYYYIAGIGPLKDYLLGLINEYGIANQAKLLGYRSDIPQLLNAADIFILPSKREGLNVSLMEAMASGLPCICGRIRGNVDLIEQPNGGLLVNPSNVGEYVESINYLIDNKSFSKMGEFNRNFIQNFDIKVVREKMIAIYKSIIPQN